MNMLGGRLSRLWLTTCVAIGTASDAAPRGSEPSCNLPYPRAAVATILVRALLIECVGMRVHGRMAMHSRMQRLIWQCKHRAGAISECLLRTAQATPSVCVRNPPANFSFTCYFHAPGA